MSKYSQALQDQAGEIHARSLQVYRLLEYIAPYALEADEPELQDAIEGVAVLAGQLSEMAEALENEVCRPPARMVAEVAQLMADRKRGEAA
jgi:hypothetical protein